MDKINKELGINKELKLWLHGGIKLIKINFKRMYFLSFRKNQVYPKILIFKNNNLANLHHRTNNHYKIVLKRKINQIQATFLINLIIS
jgi:hypothetical protein